MVRSSSTSWSKPSRTKPPSRASAGGSSMMAASTHCRTSLKSSSSPTRLRTSGAWHSVSISTRRGIAASERPSAIRSRGLAVDSAMREISRSRSRIDFSVSRSLPRSVVLTASSSTASRRSRMASRAVRGRSSHARSNRPPMGVTVRSISSSRLPARPPAIDSTISRCLSVVGSISRPSAAWRKRTERTCARSAFWVSRRYRTRAPAAHTAACRRSRPKPSSPLTRNCSSNVWRADSSSKCQPSISVTGTACCAISGNRARASTVDATTISRGRSTEISARSDARPSAPEYSATSN